MKHIKTFKLLENQEIFRNISITDEINGNIDKSNKLFAVIFIDQEDSEDTTLELWGAKDEDELCDFIKKDRADEGEDGMFEPGESPISKEVDDEWGISILPKEIGTF